MRYPVLLALLAAGAAACHDATAPRDDGQTVAPSASTQSSRPNLREERASLIAAGNQVSSAMARKGVASGLGGRLAGNVLFLAPRIATLRGKQAAIDWLSTNPTAPSAIQWGVLAADVSNDATQGFTWTGGTFTADLGTGPAEHNGFFLIYWRRGPGGAWRIAAMVFNLGGPQTGPLPPGFGTPTTRHRRSFHQVSSDRLLEIDAAFSAAAVKHGTGPAFERFAAPNAMAVGGGQFIFGPAAIGEAFASGPDDVVSWVPRFADVAESGDLGFTVGDAIFELVEVGTFFTKYLTVWQRQDDGRWRFVADFGNSRPGP
jgi:ketosteroid isomerase-like protein